MLVSLMAELGYGLYGFINCDTLIEKYLHETLDAAKVQPLLKNAFIAIQHNVSTEFTIVQCTNCNFITVSFMAALMLRCHTIS